MEAIMVGQSTATLKKRVQTLVARDDDSMLELGEALSELRTIRKQPGGDRPTLDELVGITKLSRRTICYLHKVRHAFSELGIPRDRLARAGWTKLAVIAENSEPEEMEEALGQGLDLLETLGWADVASGVVET
jgi:hypothetical protein